jgi:hypothetical protein
MICVELVRRGDGEIVLAVTRGHRVLVTLPRDAIDRAFLFARRIRESLPPGAA